jgi:hypothetical protein
LKPTGWLTRLATFGAMAALGGVTVAACQTAPGGENLGEAQSAQFANGGFESGAANAPPQSWTVQTFLNPNPNGITIQTPQTRAGLNLAAGGVANTFTLASAGGPGSQQDMALGAAASLRWPRYGNQCAIVNGPNAAATSGNPNTTGANENVNSLSQSMVIAAADVDPSDMQVHVRFVVAPVLQDPTGHANNQQPYFFIQLTNVTHANAVLYEDFNFSAQPGVAWQNLTVGGIDTYYTDWQLVDIAPGVANVAVGDTVKIEIIAGGCSLGGHWGEVYVDGFGTLIPGLFVTGTGPAQANSGANITYTLNYKNGSPSTACVTAANCPSPTESCIGGFCAENGVTIDFTPPPGTTFQSIVPPAGATCGPPAALVPGSTATITCTFTNPVPAGASGSFNITVNITAAAPGQIVAGTYDIHSNQETPLLGNKIVTNIGCALDTDCPAGNWCNEAAKKCTPTLANGVVVPTDTGHVAPQTVLNGVCTVAAGALVCTSKVCDTADNDCGYKNGDGPCNAGNGGTVCRSAVCDTDLKCGYANGDGPCTPGPTGNGAKVCRSGFCSDNGLCEPVGECFVDADCIAADWCNETTHVCTPKLTNGTQVPTDPAHANPTLNGTCAAADGPVGATVCVSGVCDPNDGKCGIANGDPGCTPATGPVVCRSTACSINDHCEPLGGCNVDADCTGGNWCNETTHTCTAKLANGVTLPNDPAHMAPEPTLNATCNPAAAALVCQSGVCDTDNKCGFLNGDGPCVAGASAACRSGVCDADNKCGYANGDGPCVPGATGNGPVVCRSTACSVSLVCEPLGGCDVDADCSGGNWCMESTHTCTAKLANGVAVPTDPPHAGPTLNGVCTVAAAGLTCVSGVCDTKDNKCGYANGDGPCTVANGPVDCRSGACSVSGVCQPSGGCTVDADCAAGNWCNEAAQMCTPKLANGTPVPTDGPHTNPTLNGTCTSAAGALVCLSGVCDPADNDCGLANGDGPCTVANGPVVCRSGACSTNGTCEPLGGCNVDADCAAGNWCNEGAHMCTPTLANGTPVPTDGPHTNPTLNGTCTTAAAALVCQSGVCDTKDNECGYANGDGPCTMTNGGTVCRSGMCGIAGTCIPSGGCVTDADCTTGNWCDESTAACLPQLPNGTVVPSDPPHTNPTLNGTCSAAAGTLVCKSGVCDTKDNECGYANGDGPCSAANGDSVCRSGICGSNNVCVACVMDSQCPGTAPHCNSTTNTCVQCVTAAQCSGGTPICDSATSTCQPCNGDQGSGTSDPCGTTAAPFCFLSGATVGACGKCATNADCAGHTGNICNTGTGLCVAGCLLDTDCTSADWCNASGSTPGMCVPKLPNGTALPSTPSSVAMCTAAVGARVCVSGVCDPKDNTCGLANGDGVCADSEQCRNNSCDSATMTCVMPACAVDAQCPSGDYCTTAGACAPKLPLGQTCSGNNQCQSGDCQQVCTEIIGSGNGLSCAASESRSTGEGGGAALVGLLLAAAGISRRSRRRSLGLR